MANTRDIIGDQATVDGLVNNTLTSLEEDGITVVGDYALSHNTALTSVNFPNATSLGGYAFDGCVALQSATAPKVVTAGSYVFQNCSSLESISMQKKKKIGSRMFSGCSSLSSVSFDAMTLIESYAFQGCKDLTNIDLSGVSSIGTYAFSSTGIGTLVIPDATIIGTYICQGTRTGTVDQHKKVDLAGNRFNSATSLCHLILRSDTMCTLFSSALNGTAIAGGIGWIYVPTDLIATYKADSTWSTYANQIVDISEYPKALQDETISDSWSTIFANEDNNTYKNVYSLGDIKYTYLNGTPLPMQIVAFDEGTSKITWLCKCAFDTRYMNPTSVTTNGWEGSNMRTWLRTKIYPMLDSTIRNRIVAVDKTYRDYTTGHDGTYTVSDTIWIPSAREIFGEYGTAYESSGVVYTDFFTDGASRAKKQGLNGLEASWFLRSAYSESAFRAVNANGSIIVAGANTEYGVVIGFCT